MDVFRVSLREVPTDDHLIFFECWAEDEDHAEEQAQDAYPEGEVRYVAVVES